MEFWSYWTIIQRNTGYLVLSKKKMEIHNINDKYFDEYEHNVNSVVFKIC